jgi:hypothetical protein
MCIAALKWGSVTLKGGTKMFKVVALFSKVRFVGGAI